jgi:hypothetical protein
MSIPKESERVARPEPQNPRRRFQIMTHIYTIATLNIKGIMNTIRIRMLEDFLRTHKIDIELLEAVTCP